MKKNPEPPWNPEKDARLIRLYEDNMTMDAIARAMHKTRSAVAGRIKRLRERKNPKPDGVDGRNIKRTKQTAVGMMKDAQTRYIMAEKPSKSFDETPWDWPGAGVQLLEVKNDQCRWPFNQKINGISMCCGKSVESGSVYCIEHRVRARA
jgi:hypothetical protein